MTEAPLRFTDNPIATDFELVNTYTSSDFTKHRLKARDATVDVALIDIPEEDTEAYIDDRCNELQTMRVDVPKPYTSEIETRDQEEPLQFRDDGDRIYGTGRADAEYNLLLEGMDQLERYLYLVTWRYFPEHDTLAEIEVYVPTGTPLEDAQELADALALDDR